MRPRHLALLALLGAALSLAACGGDDDDEGQQGPAAEQDQTPGGTYVGKRGDGAYVALVVDGRKISAYVADSEQVSYWLGAPRIKAGTTPLESRGGQHYGSVLFRVDGTAEGSVGVGYETGTSGFNFTLERATGDAGLYRAVLDRPGRRKGIEVGWVLLADGSQRGAIHFDGSGVPRDPAPKLDPGAASVSVDTGGAKPVELVPRRVERFIGLAVDY